MIPTVAAAPTMLPAPTATPTLVPQTEAVVLVVIDGARWTETLGDPDTAFVPHLAHDLAPLGAVNNAFYTEGATLSVPGHASLLTGVWQAIPNDGTVRPTTPTIFEYFRKATGASVDEAVFVHGSTIEPVLTYSTQPDYGEVFGARMFFSDEPEVPYDDGMWANAREVIATLHPRLLVISLLDPDEAAHLGQWEAYRAAIRHDDEIIWRLWQQLQGDAFYAGHTTLMVTTDHGRGCGAGWPNHGGDDDCNRHIMFLAVGPEILAGQVLTRRRTLIDIAPTIGRLLNFDTPLAEGEVMQELFEKATPTPVAYSPPAPGAGHSITVGRALSGTCA
jgi:arylsulfatase A-like enzyme